MADTSRLRSSLRVLKAAWSRTYVSRDWALAHLTKLCGVRRWVRALAAGADWRRSRRVFQPILGDAGADPVRGSTFAIKGRSYLVSPFACRVNQEVSVDEPFVNFGVMWYMKNVEQTGQER